MTPIEILDEFNKLYPNKPLAHSDDVTKLLNELAGKFIATQLIDAGWFDEIEAYTSEFNDLVDVTTKPLKEVRLDFGTTNIKIQSEFLLQQITEILREHLTRKYPNYLRKVEGNKSPWLRTITEAKPILEKLYQLGLNDDFFAFYFGVDSATFRRKRQDIIRLRTLDTDNS